jgi:competence protein ComK
VSAYGQSLSWNKSISEKSPLRDDCIWFNPKHIIDTNAVGREIEVLFSNGYAIMGDSERFYYNTKVTEAKQLKRDSAVRSNNPTHKTFYLEPKKEAAVQGA